MAKFRYDEEVRYIGSTNQYRGLRGHAKGYRVIDDVTYVVFSNSPTVQEIPTAYLRATKASPAAYVECGGGNIPIYEDAKSAMPHDGKDDKGKANPGLLFEGCGPALAEVCKVLDGGAKKYSANSWQAVPDGINRYKAAFYRHLQDMQVHGWDAVNEADFGLLHIDHAITDLLFIRSLMLKQGTK